MSKVCKEQRAISGDILQLAHMQYVSTLNNTTDCEPNQHRYVVHRCANIRRANWSAYPRCLHAMPVLGALGQPLSRRLASLAGNRTNNTKTR